MSNKLCYVNVTARCLLETCSGYSVEEWVKEFPEDSLYRIAFSSKEEIPSHVLNEWYNPKIGFNGMTNFMEPQCVYS